MLFTSSLLTMVRIRAPEFPQALPWLNCDPLQGSRRACPLSLKALRGRLVLLEFWTYGCINCLHVIPDIQDLEQKYSDHLTVIGVHTAKFDQEQNLSSIQQAIWRYGITHPVIVDSDRILWDQYAIRAYPTFVLIDPQGKIVATLVGEGRRQMLEELIQQLLKEQLGLGTLHETTVQDIVPPQTALLTSLAFPGKVEADAASNTLFIADSGHHRIVITSLDGTLNAIVGTGVAGWQDGDWQIAQFSAPQGMAWDSSRQRLYVADAGNHLLRCVDLPQQTVRTIAGTGIQSHLLFPHGGNTLAVDLNSPWDLAYLDDKLYIAMAGSHQIWVMDLTHLTIQTFTGTGAEYGVDGAPDIAAFAQPSGMTTNGTRLFVADSETSSIRAITLHAIPLVQTLCGQGQLFSFGDRDGIGDAAQLQHCAGLVYADGLLWVADTYNHKLKQVHPTTGECRTLAGQSTPGVQDGVGREAMFSEPSGLAVAHRQLYIADTNNHAIRSLNLDTLKVQTLTIPNLCAPNLCLPDNLSFHE